MHYSIICCGYNCHNYIESFYKSIYYQKYYNLDIYIVDDGSTDSGFNYFRYIKDPRIKFFRNEKNMGAAYSRLLAIRNIDRQDTICIQLDADDRLADGCIKYLDLVYQNQKIKMTIGNYATVTGINKSEIYSRFDVEKKSFFRKSYFAAVHLRTFKYELVKDIPDSIFMDEDGNWYKYCTDVPLLLWCLYKCDKNSYFRTHKLLYHYRNNRIDNTINKAGKNKEKRLIKIYNQFSEMNK